MKKIYSSHKYIFHGLFLMLVPVLACLIATLFSGGIKGLYPGASEWNDELFYYKQVEEMVYSGIPRGFFGYNESAAQYLSFGAWSPVILLPWAVFGKIFGWTVYSPIIANILYLSVTLFLFSVFAEPDLRKTIAIAVLMIAFTPVSRYLISVMPEIIIASFSVVFAGLVLGYESSGKKNARLAGMMIILFVMTAIRPYFAVLFLLPFLIGRKKTKIISAIMAFVSAASYLIISKFFCAPYFTDLFSTQWLDEFSNNGVVAGTAFFAKTLGHLIYAVCTASVKGFLRGYGLGIYFAFFLITVCLVFAEALIFMGKKKFKGKVLMGLFASEVIFFLALLLMYSLGDGFRHLLVFIILSLLFAVMCTENRFFAIEAIMLVASIQLFVVMATDSYYFGLPYEEGGRAAKEDIVDLKDKLKAEITVTHERSFDNDMIIILSDLIDEETQVMFWQYGYAVPKGIAFSICTDEYVLSTDVKSRYIMTPTGGRVEEKCIERGYRLIESNKDISVYETK